jgi:hypothetical protein
VIYIYGIVGTASYTAFLEKKLLRRRHSVVLLGLRGVYLVVICPK